jgi:homoserine kinase
MTDSLWLRLPATSANLGPGFDAMALALSFYLEIDATLANVFSLRAIGRNADVCSSLENNLLLDTYRGVLDRYNLHVQPLAINMHNQIPLGMGCGSSAAVRLAGVALASHFGKLDWDRERVLTEASLLEGHPDNTAACWLGGLAVASCHDGHVYAASIKPRAPWPVLLAMPDQPLATTAARAVLPACYDRSDAVANIQGAALLTAAFSLGRGDLLRVAMQDRIHQPFRSAICPLLPLLLPLAGRDGVLGVALSGAGPAVLLLVESSEAIARVRESVHRQIGGSLGVELLECGIESDSAACRWPK